MQFLSRELVRQVDRRAIEEYGMSGLVLMENAGRGCADVLCQLHDSGPIVVACGSGNNAGDGFVIARHLELRGKVVRVVLLSEPDRLRGDAAENYGILARSGVPLIPLANVAEPHFGLLLDQALEDVSWIVDALLGTGARGTPRPPLDRVIEQLNARRATRLAVDLPSGLDCDSGEPDPSTFRADHTCTFVAPKTGFQAAAAKPFLGELHVLDIGTPQRLLAEMGIDRSMSF